MTPQELELAADERHSHAGLMLCRPGPDGSLSDDFVTIGYNREHAWGWTEWLGTDVGPPTTRGTDMSSRLQAIEAAHLAGYTEIDRVLSG